jgi:hypothetical protein
VATNPWDFPAASVKDPPPAQLPAEAQDTDWTSACAALPGIAATAPDTPRAGPRCPVGAVAANAVAPVATASAQQLAARASVRIIRLCMNAPYLAMVRVFVPDAEPA